MTTTQVEELSQYILRPPVEQADGLLAAGLKGVLAICLQFHECPKWLAKAVSALPLPLESSDTTRKRRSGGLQGWLSPYPIFSALAYPSQAGDLVAGTAKAALLVATVRDLELATGKQLSIREVAGRAVRRICIHGSARDLVLKELEEGASSLAELAQRLHRATDKPSTDVDRELISAFARFLDYSSGVKDPPQRSDRSDTGEKAADSKSSEEVDQPEIPHRSRAHYEPLPHKERQERIRRGAPGARETPTKQVYEISDGTRTSGSSNSRMTTLRARTRARAIAVSAQNWRTGRTGCNWLI